MWNNSVFVATKNIHERKQGMEPGTSVLAQQLETTSFSSTGPVKRKSCGSSNSTPASTNNGDGMTTPVRKRSRLRSALVKSKEKPPSHRAASPSVRFGHVKIREHRRELGGSCGVPYSGCVALGLSDEYQDLKAIDVDAYERERVSQRGILLETPEKVRRMLLESAMGKENFVKRLAQEESALARTRECRQDSVANDSRYLETFDDTYGNEVHIGLDPSTVDRNNSAARWLTSPPALHSSPNLIPSLESPELLELVGTGSAVADAAEPPTCSLQTIGTV